MAELAELWKSALPKVLNGVTGRGVWAALNSTVPIVIEDGVLVLGVASQDSELAGHLRMPSTSRLIESTVSQANGTPLRVRIIDGSTVEDYELVKRRDAERRRMQEVELTKMRAEMNAKSNWDTVYEQLSRRYAAINNKSLPQNKARFYEEGVEIIAESRKAQGNFDDMGERNFARCIERLAQYAEVASTLVARDILNRVGEL